LKIPLDQVQALSIKRIGIFPEPCLASTTLEFSTSAENGTLEFHHLERRAIAWEEQIAHILEQGRRQHAEGLEKEAMRQIPIPSVAGP
jgi:hypothetical protein